MHGHGKKRATNILCLCSSIVCNKVKKTKKEKRTMKKKKKKEKTKG
jgi:uncharacterized protein YcfJ